MTRRPTPPDRSAWREAHYWMGAEPNEDENENGLLTRVRGFVSFSGAGLECDFSLRSMRQQLCMAVGLDAPLSFVIRPARCASGSTPIIPASRRRDACRNVRSTLGR